MQYVILGGLALAALVGLGQLFVRLDARTLARLARYVVGIGLIVLGVGLSFARLFQFGLPAIIFGVIALMSGRIGSFDLGGATPSGGGASRVTARYIDAALDHDSGTLTGTVREGRFEGRVLDDLGEDELRELYREVAADNDSRALLEAYLDRRIPGWREDGEDNDAARPGGSADSSAMTDQEAYEILGLAAGASEAEIRAAHRRLLKGVHPDQGGSTFLAARINQAKDRLLGKHG